MSSEPNFVKLRGSESKSDPGAVREGLVARNEPVRFDVLVRRRKLTDEAANAILAPLASDRRRHLTRDEFRNHFGSDPTELEKVAQVLQRHGVRAVETDTAKRTVTFIGTASAVSEAFRAELVRYSLPGKPAYRAYQGALLIPAEIADLVEAVVGLDSTPRFNPDIRHFPGPPRVPPHVLTPVQVAQAYRFPPFTSGAGQTIGIIELGGGFLASDITAAFSALGIAPPTVITASGTNSPGSDINNDAEVALDIQVAGGCAPGANLLSTLDPIIPEAVYFLLYRRPFTTAPTIPP